ncbi:unnamed protein product [Miscanthus lutarioriparius]|uniref:Uncharacterized protein n=1 Tax=Miscanthus lutarioriparius TaxID=422564 RepID=A0A811RFI6_9POAL|nr:unnamed protein product [Miscanthus lutarioriparius]
MARRVGAWRCGPIQSDSSIPQRPRAKTLSFRLQIQQSLTNLKEVEFLGMTELVELVGGANCHLFSGLEKIRKVDNSGCIMLLIYGSSKATFPKTYRALSSLDVSASSDEDHEEVVLQFPPSSSLRNVRFCGCKNLILPVEEEGGLGFCGISSLESVAIINCNKLFSRWPMGGGGAQTQSIIYPLPPSLKELCLGGEQSTLPMALLANLTSLTSLQLVNCKDIIVDGFVSLITINLKRLRLSPIL